MASFDFDDPSAGYPMTQTRLWLRTPEDRKRFKARLAVGQLLSTPDTSEALRQPATQPAASGSGASPKEERQALLQELDELCAGWLSKGYLALDAPHNVVPDTFRQRWPDQNDLARAVTLLRDASTVPVLPAEGDLVRELIQATEAYKAAKRAYRVPSPDCSRIESGRLCEEKFAAEQKLKEQLQPLERVSLELLTPAVRTAVEEAKALLAPRIPRHVKAGGQGKRPC